MFEYWLWTFKNLDSVSSYQNQPYFDTMNLIQHELDIDHNSNRKLNIATELKRYLAHEDHMNNIYELL